MTSEVDETPPKMFISYRWSTPDHSDWVISLATALRSDGIDVKLDRWDLKPGHDALAFMESMVTDKTIKKVLMVCDREYVERADNRQGGVGIESQIISPNVYAKTDQEKFAAVVLELDADGRPRVPAFMSSRIYFDMTTADAKKENYQEIVRWAFDKPFHIRPAVGKPPQFLDESYQSRITLPAPALIRSSEAPARGADNATAILDTVARESDKLILDLAKEPDQPEEVYKAILNTVSLRESVYTALKDLLRSEGPKIIDKAHGFFEGLVRNWDFAPENRTFSRLDNDLLHYFFHDCFVGFVALAIEESQFDLIAEFLSVPFFRPNHDGRTGQTSSYADFRPALDSLEHRNRNLKLNRISLHADMLSETHEHSVVPFSNFLEADFVLYLRGLIDEKLHWYPISALWLGYSHGSVRLFARARSTRYYERIRPLFFGKSADDFRAALKPYIDGEKRVVRYDYESLSIDRLANLENLATSA